MTQPLPKEEHDALLAQAGKSALRAKITREVGDQASLLGTTADGAALALYGVATLIKILNEHGSVAIKAAVAAAANGDLVTMADGFLANIENGTVVLPALDKGIGAVTADVEARSTGVAQLLAAAS